MTWGYRMVFQEVDPEYSNIRSEDDRFWVSIREVYYDDDGFPNMFTGSMAPTGDGILELTNDIDLMREALEAPPLVLYHGSKKLKELTEEEKEFFGWKE